MYEYTGCETTLDPPPQPQLQQPKNIYAHIVKIWSMSDSVAKLQELELIFDGLKLSFFLGVWTLKIRQKNVNYLPKSKKVS